MLRLKAIQWEYYFFWIPKKITAIRCKYFVISFTSIFQTGMVCSFFNIKEQQQVNCALFSLFGYNCAKINHVGCLSIHELQALSDNRQLNLIFVRIGENSRSKINTRKQYEGLQLIYQLTLCLQMSADQYTVHANIAFKWHNMHITV